MNGRGWIYASIAAFIIAFVAVWYDYNRKKKMDGFRHFTFSEFDQPGLPGSGRTHMSVAFIQKLDDARERAGVPFIITSGYRSPAYNATLANAVADSAHTKGLAADIAAVGPMRLTVARALYKAGIRRFGFGSTFVHADVDASKPQNVVWGYSGNPAPYTLAQIAA